MSGTGTVVSVLHVDDEPEFADLTAEFLERTDDRFTVETATSASEGLESLADGAFDCVVSDYEMPGQNGIEFLEAVRAEYPELPFILFTGEGSEEVASDAISAGVTDYLQKGGIDQYELLANRIINAVEHTRAQRERKRSERRFEAIFEDPASLIGVLDPDGTLLRANSSAMQVIDADREDVIGQPFWETPWWEPVDSAEVREWIERAAEGEYVDVDSSFASIFGERRHVTGTVRPVTDETGEVISLVVSGRDVTERREREQELRRYEQMVNTAADMVYILDTEGRFAFVNDAAEALTGYSRDRLLDSHIEVLMDEDDLEAGRDLVASLLSIGDRDRVSDSFTWTLYTADGETVSCESHVSLLYEGDDWGGTVGVVRDVSERMRAEERLEAFVNNASDILSVIGPDGTVRETSPAAERIVGWSPGELEDDLIFEYVHPDDRERVADEFVAMVQESGFQTKRVQYRFRHKDGSWRWLESVGSNRSHTELEGYVVVSRDITERRERERRLEQQNERLEQFASIVSHDLRNPLNVAQGHLDLARAEVDSDHLEDVARAQGRMETLIDDLLRLARGEDHASDPEPVPLAELIEECWHNVDTKDAMVAVETDRTIRADPSRLRQLFENLFRNAVEHGSTSSDAEARRDTVEPSAATGRMDASQAVGDGSANVTVTVGDCEDGFYVADDGPGIPASERNRVFEAGYSTAEDGTGFGLQIVRQVADAHDWAVEITESEAGGARFEVTDVEFVEE